MHSWIVLGALAATAVLPSFARAEGPATPSRRRSRSRRGRSWRSWRSGSRRSSGSRPRLAARRRRPGRPRPRRLRRAPARTRGCSRCPTSPAVGSFAAEWSGAGGEPAFLFEELELGLRSVVDPYARADLFIAFGPDGTASMEEGYLTTLSLPAGLQVKAGRFFSPWGRINTQHPHTWDFVDGPLARERVLADEVLAGPGVELSWLAPLPWFAELHVAAQSTAPAEGDDKRLTGIVRLAQFFSVTDKTTLGVGLSAGRRDEGGAFRDLGGADLFLRWRAAAGRAAVTLQGELFGRRFTGGEGGGRWQQRPAQAGMPASGHRGIALRSGRSVRPCRPSCC